MSTAGKVCFDFCWDGLVLASAVMHLYLAPYTKVEESFGIQAARDFLIHGTDLSSFDHQRFPGSVPRTFLGSLVAACLSSPAVFAGAPPLILLYSVRLSVTMGSVLSHARLRCVVAQQWGPTEAKAFAAITAMQFHLPFYMSRTLPNTFALMLANLAHAELIKESGYKALAILGMAAAIFRCDLLVMIAPAGLLFLVQGRVRFFHAAAVTAIAAAMGAAISICVDSVMWGRLLWPEFEVLWFNTAENRSNEWGTSPPWWYFSSALPRALLGAAPFVGLGVLHERRTWGPVYTSLAFVALYSMLPHKELRFIFPALPLLNTAAAAGVARCFRMKGAAKMLGLLAIAGLASASIFINAVTATASAANYPGGTAIVRLQATEPAEPPLTVHIGNLAAISGVSRFLEAHPRWEYSKKEGIPREGLGGHGFDRLLTEWDSIPGYRCKARVLGFERVSLQKSLPPLKVVKAPKVFVLAKSSDGATVPCTDSSPTWG